MVARTTVVVIGAGPAGLTVGNLLRRSGIDCVLLERRPREHVELRQRAGVVEFRAVRMFDEWGLADAVIGDIPADGALELRVDGRATVLGADTGDGGGATPMVLCPQQVLVRRSIAAFLADGGDLRFGATVDGVRGLDGDRPTVSYTDATGQRHEIECDYLAGCDGDRGGVRDAVPAGVLTEYPFDHRLAWLTVLADTAPPANSTMAVSRQGFAGHFARGPAAGRYYLQCGLDDSVDDWPDERIWSELRSRLGQAGLAEGPITDREVFRLRSVVREPMSYRRLFLVGDSAHVVAPLGGKGMNLALHDAEMFVLGVRDAVRSGDTARLDRYSADCLRRVWNYQEFSRWLTETLHDAGDDSLAGPFRRRLALARLDRLVSSPSAARAFADLLAGIA
jgi:p-hydroxybenzoate 3-monooxygenase